MRRAYIPRPDATSDATIEPDAKPLRAYAEGVARRETESTAREAWLELATRLLRPARADLAVCRREGERHREGRRLVASKRAAALADCVTRIEGARAAVFTADDGAVPRLMTDLEREWRTLARTDPDDGLMDLWARMTPVGWHDRKRWRDSSATATATARLDVAIALAADIGGVEAAEAATVALRAALAAWGVHFGERIRWTATPGDAREATALLREPLATAQAALAGRLEEPMILARAEETRSIALAAARAHLPARPELAEAIGGAAFLDSLARAGGLGDRPNPVTALRALFRSGYALATVDSSGANLEVPLP